MNHLTPITPALPSDAVIAGLVATLAGDFRAGHRIGRRRLRRLLCDVYGRPEGPGSWDWRFAQDLCEATLARTIANNPCMTLGEAEALGGLLPPASHRSESQVTLQQFSTPPGVAWLAARAAALLPTSAAPKLTVLEPSAGTGLLAAPFAATGARLLLNELDPVRATLLKAALARPVTRHDAIRIADLTEARVDRAVLNPPFSTSAARRTRRAEWTDHLAAAWSARAPGGRLVALLPATAFDRGADTPEMPPGAVLRTAIALPRGAFRASGTSMPVRLVVLDSGAGISVQPRTVATLAEAAALLDDLPPPKTACDEGMLAAERPLRPARPRPRRGLPVRAWRSSIPARTRPDASTPEIVDLACHAAPVPERTSDIPADSLYQPWHPKIAIEGFAPHPTPLVVSGALGAICPPLPKVPVRLPRQIIDQGLLSDAQGETLVLATGAFARDLAGRYMADPATGTLTAIPDGADAPAAADGQGASYRQGFFLGDGTGVGKGRQVAAIFCAARADGAAKGVWVSKTDTLIEDARRDWQALGGRAADILPQSAWKPADPITALSGIVFTTYATLRQDGRGDAPSRLDQLLAWLGPDFEGVIAFDEAHAMANALAAKTATPNGDRTRAASKQGLAGVRLQAALPRARVVYVSATGAASVAALGFAPRLGLWGGPASPFATADAFVAAMEAGGVAALEMICRDLARLGLYQARALSFEGVDYAPLEHRLSARDIAIWDAWAEAFQVLHQNLDAALKATGVLDTDGATRNGAAKGAALSAFESMKQRFFGHLLMALKCESLIEAIETDLAEGRSAVVQIISTSAAILDRRLAELDADEIAVGEIEMGPADLVMDYVAASFPTVAMQITADADGREIAEPLLDAHGNPVESREAARLRDAFLERLGALPEIQGALDCLIAHFGVDQVAECTGRTRRLLPDPTDPMRRRIGTRGAQANSAEAAAFQAGAKRILVFSEAGGTGRSYHADSEAGNRQRRVHYLLEPGWRADLAIQGLGRTHRSNQVSAPLFRPVTTDVMGERRFLSTIARRLDALGALTRGQRETGGQNLFRPEDNLESPEAAVALRIFFMRLARGEIASIGLARFIEMTGLTKILDRDGSLRDELPPMRQFLNRLLALPMATQNAVFGDFVAIVEGRVAAARQAGTLDLGIETIRADRLAVAARQVLAIEIRSGAVTELLTLERQAENRPRDLAPFTAPRRNGLVRAMVNTHSARAALAEAGPTLIDADGKSTRTVRLLRPFQRQTLTVDVFAESNWEYTDEAAFETAWAAEIAAAPAHRTDRLTMIAGLLLPYWHLLPEEDMRVRRAILDDGEVLLGRMVTPRDVARICEAFGATPPAMAPEDRLAAILAGQSQPLGEGRGLRRATVAGGQRLELTGVEPADLDWLKARGWWTEIIRHRTRVFLALPEPGGEVPAPIAAVIARWSA